MPADDGGDHLRLHPREHLRVAEEAGDVDQQVVGQAVHLLRVAAQQRQEAGQVGSAGQLHAAFDAPVQRARLVRGEVVPGRRPQQLDDGPEDVPGPCVVCDVGRCGGRGMGERGQRVRDLRRRENEVGDPRGDRAARHAVVLRFGRILHDHQAAALLDRRQAEAAVAAGAGQDDAHGPVRVVLRQGLEQEVEGQALPPWLRRL